MATAERATNPFLRPDSPDLQATIGMPGGDLVDVFAETRRLKDKLLRESQGSDPMRRVLLDEADVELPVLRRDDHARRRPVGR